MSVAVIKRKMDDPLRQDLSTDYSEVKRARPAKPVGLCAEVRKRVLCVLQTLMQHIFALPFVKIETDQDTTTTNNNKLFFDDVYENVENNVFGSIQEIMDDLNKVLDSNKSEDGNLDFCGKMLRYKAEDIDVMAKYLKKEIEIFHDKEFSASLRRPLILDSLSEFIGNNQSDEIIFSKLKSRYEHVPDVMLFAKALELSFGHNVDVKSIEEELEQRESEEIFREESDSKPKYRSYKFLPCRNHDFDMDKVQHSYIAGYQFHKMITKATTAPIAMRTILNMSDAIDSITYIENDETTSKYEEQRDLFVKEGKVNDTGKVEEMLLFHGTAVASLENILSSNFMLDALPLQVNTQNETRKKTMMFGRGIYFSEIPAISLMYGNGLLLCKVMLGRCEAYKPQGSTPQDIPAHFDSREVKSFENEGVIHVVKNSAQIMPYCVIRLKSKSLTSQFIKPLRGQSGPGCCPTHGLSCINCPSLSSLSSLSPLACQLGQPGQPGQTGQTGQNGSSSLTWSQVERTEEFGLGGRRRREVAEETVKQHSRPCPSHDVAEVCSICCDSLGQEDPVVSLALCGHTFHSACLTGLVEHQAGQHHLQCPNCQTIHGVRTGNMPTTGKMMYARHTASLPGYPDSGMILIKYVFNNGVQDQTHPNPGKPFNARGFPRTALLPDNEKGERVLQMLITAFQRRLTFTIGRSVSRGEDDCVTWNGIHHKTVLRDAGTGHGFPDTDYLDRVIQELNIVGVTESENISTSTH